MNSPQSPSQLVGAGAFLADAPGLSFEWSLRLARNGAAVRERMICWLRPAEGEQGGYDGLAGLLEAQSCPAGVRAHQARLASTSISQGVGLSGSAGHPDRSVYIHHTDSATGQARYDAWRWSDEGEVEESSYRFHFLSGTGDQCNPEQFVHPALVRACAAYAGNERIVRTSGVWLRHRRGHVDQTCLTYPWLPELAEAEAGLLALFPLLASDAVYLLYRKHHFRHLSFNSNAETEPSVTVYLSAPWQGTWPVSSAEVRATVRVSAATLARQIDQYLAPEKKG